MLRVDVGVKEADRDRLDARMRKVEDAVRKVEADANRSAVRADPARAPGVIRFLAVRAAKPPTGTPSSVIRSRPVRGEPVLYRGKQRPALGVDRRHATEVEVVPGDLDQPFRPTQSTLFPPSPEVTRP